MLAWAEASLKLQPAECLVLLMQTSSSNEGEVDQNHDP